MAAEFISVTDTAKLIRKALKEAFPGVKFSVKSSSYSGGASVGIRWTDGPNEAQVKAVAGIFRGAYFDGSIDYQGSISHMMGGKPVRFGADYVNLSREFSDAAIERAIARVFRMFAGNFTADAIECPTVAQFRSGNLYRIHLRGMIDDLQREIAKVLHKSTDSLKVNKSKTAGAVFVTHDDGYSKAHGSGFSAVSTTLQ